MKNKIISLMAIIMTVMMIAPTMATVIQTTNLYSHNGAITVTQHGNTDVAFLNNLKMDTGRLTFSQNIDTNYGHFDNDVMLHGNDLRIKNTAGEQSVPGHNVSGVGWIPKHRTIGFDQNIYMGESSHDWDAAKSKQVFYNGDHSKYIAQRVQVNPTSISGTEVEPDRMDMWNWVNGQGKGGQSGMLNNYNVPNAGHAGLQQVAQVHADYNFASQWSNIGGSIGSTIETFNNPSWMNFKQEISWQ